MVDFIRSSRRTNKFAGPKLSSPYDRQFMMISRLFTIQICRNHLVLAQNSIRAPVQISWRPRDLFFLHPNPIPPKRIHTHTYLHTRGPSLNGQ